jgi:IS1 family transposase
MLKLKQMLDRSSIIQYIYDMNQLSNEKRAQIINLLVEGNSMRATTRITGVSINTVTKLLVDIGGACAEYHNTKVTGLNTKRVEVDEIWSFVYAKDKNATEAQKTEGAGDTWTWVGMDAESKLVIAWLVGDRTGDSAKVIMEDIAVRLNNRVQLTTDGHKAYLEAVSNAFGNDIDFAQLIKMYGGPGKDEQRKYSPAECTGIEKKPITGNPDSKLISTSYIERQNLTMRMHMRRFTRLTNGFSKKRVNHFYAICLHFMYYNFCKVHKTLKSTPAMAAGLTEKPWTIFDLVKLLDSQDGNSN